MRPRAALIALLACVANSTAFAAEGGYWVDWQAPERCPALGTLNEQISARSDRARSNRTGSQYVIRVTDEASGYVAARATLPNGSVRFVRAARCEEVVEALAFIVSMDLEQQPTMPEVPPAAPDPAAESDEQPRRWSTYLGSSAGIAGGYTTPVMPIGGLFFELSDASRAFWRSARVSVAFGAGQLGRAADDPAVSLVQGVLELCPIGVGPASVCGGLQGGALIVRGGEALANETTLRPSLAARLGVALRWDFHADWSGGLDGGAMLPLILDEFVVERSDQSLRSVRQVAASGYATISIARRF